MSSTASRIKRSLVGTSILLLAGGALGGVILTTDTLRTERAARLTVVAEAQLTNNQVGEAAVSLQVARWLDAENSNVRLQSARLAVMRDNPAGALALLNGAPATAQTVALTMRAQSLHGDIGSAAVTAGELLELPEAEPSDVLAAVSLRKFATPTAVVATDSYPAVARQGLTGRLQSLASDNVSAAQELYAQRLLGASKALLDCVKIESVAYYRLQADLELNHKPTEATLSIARGYLEKAAALNPADIEVRRGLIQINERLKDEAAAAKHRELLKQLESGQI